MEQTPGQGIPAVSSLTAAVRTSGGRQPGPKTVSGSVWLRGTRFKNYAQAYPLMIHCATSADEG
jgi:hypothetical protein